MVKIKLRVYDQNHRSNISICDPYWAVNWSGFWTAVYQSEPLYRGLSSGTYMISVPTQLN